MKRKITPAIPECAIIEVPDFESVIKKLSGHQTCGVIVKMHDIEFLMWY